MDDIEDEERATRDGWPFHFLLRSEYYSRSLRFQFSRSPSVVLEDEEEDEDWLEGVL